MDYEKIIGRSVEPDPKYEYLFLMPSGKYNTTVKLTEEDRRSGCRIYCKEPYAQELYNKFVKRVDGVYSKDLTVNTIYTVRAISYNSQDKLVRCIEENSGAEIFVPMSEVKNKTDEINNGKTFKVMLQKNVNGFNYASLKKCEKLINKEMLQEFLDNKTDFDVVVKRLVKGGFIAVYDNSVECFVPGAHAAANVIHDFESYLGKTIRVVVDNYDQESQTFVVSHKKYIKKILPERIHDIKFGTAYKGVLTSNPTDFGAFVEFAVDPAYGSIFTGLVHISELTGEYSNLKQGQEVEFYVSRIIYNAEKKNYKINLTFDKSKIDSENLYWQDLKDNKEGKVFNYIIEEEKLVLLEGEDKILSITIDTNNISKEIVGKEHVKLSLIDVINKQVGVDFIK